MRYIVTFIFISFILTNAFGQETLNCESARQKYLEANPDVKNAGVDPWNHYLGSGKFEGRKWYPCLEQISFTIDRLIEDLAQDCESARQKYLEANPDVKNAGVDPWNHYLGAGKFEGRKWYPCPGQLIYNCERAFGNEAYDCESARQKYLEANPDVKNAGVNPWEHYINNGKNEGRKWYPCIEQIRDCESARQKYLEANPDVKNAGVNPWEHYINNGKNEGRKWYPCIEQIRDCESARQKYLEANPDVKNAGVNPWEHYINNGKNEGRKWYSCIEQIKSSKLQENNIWFLTPLPFYNYSDMFQSQGATESDNMITLRRYLRDHDKMLVESVPDNLKNSLDHQYFYYINDQNYNYEVSFLKKISNSHNYCYNVYIKQNNQNLIEIDFIERFGNNQINFKLSSKNSNSNINKGLLNGSWILNTNLNMTYDVEFNNGDITELNYHYVTDYIVKDLSLQYNGNKELKFQLIENKVSQLNSEITKTKKIGLWSVNFNATNGFVQNGKGVYTINNDTIYAGNYLNNLPDGFGITNNPKYYSKRIENYTRYEGDFSSGRILGRGKMKLEDGSWEVGHWVDGVKQIITDNNNTADIFIKATLNYYGFNNRPVILDIRQDNIEIQDENALKKAVNPSINTMNTNVIIDKNGVAQAVVGVRFKKGKIYFLSFIENGLLYSISWEDGDSDYLLLNSDKTKILRIYK
jgi:hypothetical protein